ncbi:MAG: calcium-binding protein [Okeania sp. SIO3C4]|nr:calcium-binding protein [Okeania sp. SIO3C4]
MTTDSLNIQNDLAQYELVVPGISFRPPLDPDNVSRGVDSMSVELTLDDIDSDQVVFVDEMPTIVDNLINGTPEADRLRGEDGTNGISGSAGDDTLFGGSQLDILAGEEGDDVLRGGDGDDRLKGGDGNDRLLGGGNRDNLEGGSGDDLLRGGLGRDILRGDEGRDVLIGGRASDVFILQSDLGSDRIKDFTVGQDKLGLVDTFGVSDLSIRQVGDNTAIFNGTNRLAILVGVDADSITTNDFTQVIFAV